jgi:hypothetical protein
MAIAARWASLDDVLTLYPSPPEAPPAIDRLGDIAFARACGSARMGGVSLRGQPLEQEATLPDGRPVRVRVGLAEDSYIPPSEIDTVVLELWDEHRGEHLGGVATILSADDDEEALALLRAVVRGLEAGELEPTAGAIERLADSVPEE